MDTAGKAVLFSGATVLISLSAVMLVPSPAFRSMALGIMLAVVFILAASLTLLPATLAKLGPKVDKGALRWVHSGEHRSPAFAAWAERLWRHPVVFGTGALAILLVLALPIFGLRTGMPSIKVVPTGDTSRQGYALVQQALRARRTWATPDRRTTQQGRRRRKSNATRLPHRPRPPHPDRPQREARADRGRPQA